MIDRIEPLPARRDAESGRRAAAFLLRAVSALMISAMLAGCEAESKSSVRAKPKSKASQREAATASPEAAAAPEATKKKKFQPVELGRGTGDKRPATPAAQAKLAEEKRGQAVVDALQPFQLLLGRWRWIVRTGLGDSRRTGEDLEWVWDFQTDAKQPALTAESATNPYFEELRLTYLPDREKFQLATHMADGPQRVLEGAWSEGGEPKEIGDGRTLQRSYKLQLTQVLPATGDQWQLTLTQLDNDQYLLDLAKRSAFADRFGPLDNVRQQRLGTSFALVGSDNPGPKCIISGGLGTMTVAYKGKSYPVCCSGCAAAFTEDPERWLARLAAKEKSKGIGDQ
ncbi:MAG TPA: hypothetical protein VKU82_07515 [Planctomycetaceae bacterium]|nr:hypothetical protein [Planctomycetaceae bacterium]